MPPLPDLPEAREHKNARSTLTRMLGEDFGGKQDSFASVGPQYGATRNPVDANLKKRGGLPQTPGADHLATSPNKLFDDSNEEITVGQRVQASRTRISPAPAAMWSMHRTFAENAARRLGDVTERRFTGRAIELDRARNNERHNTFVLPLAAL